MHPKPSLSLAIMGPRLNIKTPQSLYATNIVEVLNQMIYGNLQMFNSPPLHMPLLPITITLPIGSCPSSVFTDHKVVLLGPTLR